MKDIIKAQLKEHAQNTEVFVFDTIDSTNTEARRLLKSGLVSDCIIIAKQQTAGRGRQGKSFYSPENSGLYFTVVLQKEIPFEEATRFTAVAAVAVSEALEKATKKDPKIKWVNDIFLDGKKVCGILTESFGDLETMMTKGIIIGIGINLTTSDFPEELKDIAGSVERDIPKEQLVGYIFERLKTFSDDLQDKSIMDEYRKRSLVLGNQVFFQRNGENYSAKGETITDNGELVVITDKGERIVLNSGEISVKLK